MDRSFIDRIVPGGKGGRDVLEKGDKMGSNEEEGAEKKGFKREHFERSYGAQYLEELRSILQQNSHP